MSIFRLPEFNLYNQLGELVTQDTFMGKKLVLYFYPKDNTSGCTKQAQEFSLKIKEFEALDFMIVGVSKDSENNELGSANVNMIVKINEHAYDQLAGGV